MDALHTLLFGTAGIPHAARGSPTQEAIPAVREMGLGAMELEFVRSINISKGKAPVVREAAKKAGIVLTCHAPYFINLNSLEKATLDASIRRIVDSCRIMGLCGGYSVCFHPGFYQKETKESTFANVRNAVKRIVRALKEEGIGLWVRPETTGKPSQFGDMDELLALSAEFDQVMPCIDFAHFHARTNGKYNTYPEFASILESVEKTLGRDGLRNIHAHAAGIAYGEKGEKHHLNLRESDLKYKELMKALADFNVKGVLISESPNIEGDALLMQKEYKEHSRR
ncbi:TPA: TIM barrel protein [Candidatus Woesearchaeota archaeon]|nr:TIM barrel protein [Candidatus Woesearchaeota archaeon]